MSLLIKWNPLVRTIYYSLHNATKYFYNGGTFLAKSIENRNLESWLLEGEAAGNIHLEGNENEARRWP